MIQFLLKSLKMARESLKINLKKLKFNQHFLSFKRFVLWLKQMQNFANLHIDDVPFDNYDVSMGHGRRIVIYRKGQRNTKIGKSTAFTTL